MRAACFARRRPCAPVPLHPPCAARTAPAGAAYPRSAPAARPARRCAPQGRRSPPPCTGPDAGSRTQPPACGADTPARGRPSPAPAWAQGFGPAWRSNRSAECPRYGWAAGRRAGPAPARPASGSRPGGAAPAAPAGPACGPHATRWRAPSRRPRRRKSPSRPPPPPRRGLPHAARTMRGPRPPRRGTGPDYGSPRQAPSGGTWGRYNRART